MSLGVAAVLAAAPVKVEVQVVHASNGAPHVDPGLEKMREGFEKAGLRFTTYRRLSEQTVTLTAGKPTEVAMPGKTATLTLEPGEHPRPRVAVSVPPLRTTVELGTDASAFLQAGPHENGQLVLVLAAKK
ncbi:MAG TPA: hypothetical protein VFE93_04145 [Myxococcaceae bacterium]|nr:hypothetical protein [Myxococcaceae bacterium]